MKKLYKLKDGAGKGGAVGSGLPIGSVAGGSSAIGLPKGLSEGSVRPWIFDHSRRLRQADLKRHEIRYMDLTEREAQLIRKKARPKQSSRTQELSGSFHEDFLGDSLDDDPFSESDDVGRKEGFKENPEVYVLGAILFLLIWSLVLIAFLL